MNHKQYMAIGFFFLVLLFFLPIIVGNAVVLDSSNYFSVRNGILSAAIYLSYPLMILFFVLAGLEQKKKH